MQGGFVYRGWERRDPGTRGKFNETHTRRYVQHGLTLTSKDRIKSEAGIGKAYLREMGIQPWRLMQPDFPPDIINIIMQTYYGGRSEVHMRRVLSQVLYCDFLSMYATVCTLMGLWRF